MAGHDATMRGWADDPVEPLGLRGQLFFYRRRCDGEIVDLFSAEHVAPALIALTGGEVEFWHENFAGDFGIDWHAAAAWCMAGCFSLGLYLPEEAAVAAATLPASGRRR